MLNCNLEKCRADCCGACPIPNRVVRTFTDLIHPDAEIQRAGAVSFVFVPETLKCGFLSSDYKCKIYDNRPDVCRKFGEDSDPILRCHHLGQCSKEESDNMVKTFIDEVKHQ